MNSPKLTTDESMTTVWTPPADGEWEESDIAQQHMDDLLEVRAGAMLQVVRLAASEVLNSESAFAVVEQAIGKVVELYDHYHTQVYLDGQPPLALPLNMAELYFEKIQS